MAKFMKVKIHDLKSENIVWIKQISKILIDTFGEKNEDDWEQEIYESFDLDRISRVCIDEITNEAIAWIGGISQYNGNVWELHPLVVKKEYRYKKIGSLLVKDFENQVKKRGGLTIWLGTDDEDNRTSLSNVNLYDDIYYHIKNIKNYKMHPYEFYQKMGFQIVGVMPDANGIGKPDIYMAKRVKY